MSARDLFHPEDKTFSRAEERAYAREELIYNVTEDLLLAMEDREVSRKELARRLGKSRSFVSQILSGARNMTLGSLSDICFALGLKPRVVIGDLNHQETMATVGMDAHWVESARTLTLRSPEGLNAANRDGYRRIIESDGKPEWVTERPEQIA